MSTTTDIKRPWAEAAREARAFIDLFPKGTYADWKVAGSLRRRRPEVGDIDHVVVPKLSEGFPSDLLGGNAVINETWEQLEKLVNDRRVVRDHARPCWGEKHRRVLFSHGAGVFDHEIYLADEQNLGSILAIRTGPAEYSRHLVTQLRTRWRRNDKGYVWECEKCPVCVDGRVNEPWGGSVECGICDGTTLKPVKILPAPTEEAYFELCGVPFVPPEKRG